MRAVDGSFRPPVRQASAARPAVVPGGPFGLIVPTLAAT